MGFGISSFTNRGTRKALISWIEPTSDSDNGFLESMWNSAVNFLTLSLIGDLNPKSITPDVRKAEAHKYRSSVTEVTLEDGSIAAQHIIQHPIEVTLTFEETNSGKMIANVLNSLGIIDQVSTFDKLTDIWRRKIPVVIMTEQAQYVNMVIENMPIIQRAPYKGALQIMCDFKQLSYGSIYLPKYRGTTKSIQKSANETIQGGMQKVIDIGQNVPVAQVSQAIRGAIGRQ